MVSSWRCPHCIVVLIVEGVWWWVDGSIMAMPSLHCGSCCRGSVEVGRWFHHGDALIALWFLLQRECGAG